MVVTPVPASDAAVATIATSSADSAGTDGVYLFLD